VKRAMEWTHGMRRFSHVERAKRVERDTECQKRGGGSRPPPVNPLKLLDFPALLIRVNVDVHVDVS
jgi:hypothetical protein